MARLRPRASDSEQAAPATDAGWTGLTWDDLERWAGGGSVSRGRTYQRGGRVKDLRISADGELLATVTGDERYATLVALEQGMEKPSLGSSCTCPVGDRCKHAVAVVAEYLQAVASKTTVPLAGPDDPRRAELDGDPEAEDDRDDEEDDGDSWDDSGPERLLFAIDAELADENEAIGEAIATVFNIPADPEHWLAVADTLAGRQVAGAVGQELERDSFSRNYQRDRSTSWIATALRQAGRAEEVRDLYESEARVTGSYVRLVDLLLEMHCFDDAERWAQEGIAATIDPHPGIADQLAASLCEVAHGRGQWDVVAAHAARPFFERPGRSNLDKLLEAAARAGVEGLGRADEWTSLLASIREKHRNRPRFMEILDRLDGRTILQSSRTKRK